MTGFYNMPVIHPELGEGRIKAWDGRTITIRYANAEKRYWFPRVFSTEELKTTNEKDEAVLQETSERWVNAVITRETTGLGVKRSDEEVQAVIVRIRAILLDVYNEEEILERVTKILEAKEKVVSQSSEGKVGFTKNSEFTGGAFANFGINFLTVLATVFSLGIAYPFMLCWKLRWQTEHTIIDGQKLTFDGNGGQLFGKYVVWWLLSAVTFGIYYILCVSLKMKKWTAKHTHFAQEQGKESTFDGKLWGYYGARLLARFVTGVTLGLGAYWAHCYLERWCAKHTVYDGYRLDFDGTGMQYFGKCIVWVLLTVVTIGIYGFWLTVKSKKWTISHTHLA